MVSSVASGLTLLDKQGASDADVIELMNKQYKDGISSVTWRLPQSYDIKKREIGDERYEYSTTFTARKDQETSEGPQTKRFRVTAKVNPDGKISFLKMAEQSDEKKEEEKPAAKPKKTEGEPAKSAEKPKVTEKPKPVEKSQPV